MPSYISIPLQVFSIGAVISFGIALLMKFMLDVISHLGKKNNTK